MRNLQAGGGGVGYAHVGWEEFQRVPRRKACEKKLARRRRQGRFGGEGRRPEDLVRRGAAAAAVVEVVVVKVTHQLEAMSVQGGGYSFICGKYNYVGSVVKHRVWYYEKS